MKPYESEPQVGKVTLFKPQVDNMNSDQTASEFPVITLSFFNVQEF